MQIKNATYNIVPIYVNKRDVFPHLGWKRWLLTGKSIIGYKYYINGVEIKPWTQVGDLLKESLSKKS